VARKLESVPALVTETWELSQLKSLAARAFTFNSAALHPAVRTGITNRIVARGHILIGKNVSARGRPRNLFKG
jgi:hypothetical protein